MFSSLDVLYILSNFVRQKLIFETLREYDECVENENLFLTVTSFRQLQHPWTIWKMVVENGAL